MFHPSQAPTKNARRRVVCCGARPLTAPTPTVRIRKKKQQTFPATPEQAATAQMDAFRGEFVVAKSKSCISAVLRGITGVRNVVETPCVTTPAIPEGPHCSLSDAVTAGARVGNTNLGACGDGDDVLRLSMSRRGLSVHAAPFKPRHLADISTLSLTPCGFEPGDFAFIQEEQQRRATGSSGALSRTTTHCQLTPQGAAWPSGLEFPLTPSAAEAKQTCFSSPTDNVPCASTVLATSSVNLCRGDAWNYSSPLPPVFFNTAKQRHGFYNGINAGSSSGEHVAYVPDDKGDSMHDNIRHRRVAVTDAEAMDEAVMLDMLRCSSSSDGGDDGNDDDEEDAVYIDHYQQQHMFDVAPVHPTDLGVCSCAGGYWDPQGPTAATRRLLHRGRNSSTASLTLTALSGRASPTFVSGGGILADCSGVGDFYNEVDDDLWEMNSSAYEDSLDELQVEWIEQQLHAKENPDGFFP